MILSIVGADRLPASGYLRAKVAQERAGHAVADVPFSIVRSTQFFEFVPGIADAGTRDGVVHATPAHLQPIASRDVVAHLAEVVTGPPLRRAVEVARPGSARARRPRPPPLRRHAATPGPWSSDRARRLLRRRRSTTPRSRSPRAASAWIAPTTYDAWLAGSR